MPLALLIDFAGIIAAAAGLCGLTLVAARLAVSGAASGAVLSFSRLAAVLAAVGLVAAGTLLVFAGFAPGVYAGIAALLLVIGSQAAFILGTRAERAAAPSAARLTAKPEATPLRRAA